MTPRSGTAPADAPARGRFPALILALRWATVATGAALSLLDAAQRRWRPWPPRRSSASTPASGSSGPLPRPDGRGRRRRRHRPGAGRRRWRPWPSAAVGTARTSSSSLVPVLLAGFTQGYVGGFVAAGAASVPLLAARRRRLASAQAPPETASQVVLVYAATGALAGYARRLFVDAVAEQASFEDRVSSLTEANALLSQLTRWRSTLPSSLDLGDTVTAAMGHLRQLFDFTGRRRPRPRRRHRHLAGRGRHRPAGPAADDHQPAAAAAAAAGAPERLGGPGRRSGAPKPTSTPPPADPGLWPDSRSGLYAPLVARDHLVALVALERVDGDEFEARDADVLTGLAEPLALAIDNGLWFDRLRMLGAEGERDRLARDLHDRFAQGLAYVNLELDRLSRHPDPGPELVELRAATSTACSATSGRRCASSGPGSPRRPAWPTCWPPSCPASPTGPASPPGSPPSRARRGCRSPSNRSCGGSARRPWATSERHAKATALDVHLDVRRPPRPPRGRRQRRRIRPRRRRSPPRRPHRA